MRIERPKSIQPIPSHAKRVFKGIIFDVYQWEQKQFDNSVKIFEKLKRPDTVMTIGVTEDKRIIVSQQQQPGTDSFGALIGGRVDEGEEPLAAAKRELEEESGYTSNDWELFETVQPSVKIDWVIYYFIAKNCRQVSKQKLESGEKIEIKLFDFDKFVDFLTNKNFRDRDLRIKILEAKCGLENLDDFRKKLGV